MTYDIAVWKPSERDHSDPTVEFERRSEANDARYPDFRPPIPELLRLADLLEAEFPEPRPWEDLRGSLDGDFLYLTMAYQDGERMESFLTTHAPPLGLVVYSPISEEVLRPDS